MTSIFVCLIFAKNKQTKKPMGYIQNYTKLYVHVYIYIFKLFFFFGPFIFGSFFVAAIEKKCFRQNSFQLGIDVDSDTETKLNVGLVLELELQSVLFSHPVSSEYVETLLLTCANAGN